MSESQMDRALLQECVGDGAAGVQQMIAEVSTIAEQFRQADVAPANVGLARLAEDLNALVVLVQALRAPLAAIDQAAMTAMPSDADIEKLVAWLESLVQAQVSADWLTVSDVLEYDVEPELRNWLGQFETVKQKCAA